MDVPGFLIKNGSSDFLNKQKNIFGLLAEKEQDVKRLPRDNFVETDEHDSKKRKRRETKHFRGKESLFKAPMDVPPRGRRVSQVPDFQRNPHRWVKYSLADVTQDDMSNESNTAAAFSFLKDVKQANKTQIKMELGDEDEDEDEDVDRISKLATYKFMRPKRTRVKKQCFGEPVESVVDNASASDKPIFKNSKLIMPEYVVGQVKKQTKNIQKKVKAEKAKEIHLDHIHEYEDD